MFRKSLSFILVCLVILSSFAVIPAGALDKSCKDEIIDAILASENDVWRVEQTTATLMKFLDLNFDGKPEFIVQYGSDKSGYSAMSTAIAYVYAYKNNEMVDVGGCNINNQLTGYYDKTTGNYFLLQSKNVDNGQGGVGRIFNYSITFDGEKVSTNCYTSERITLKSPDNKYDTDNVFYKGNCDKADESKVISHDEYNKINSEIVKDCVKVNMEYTTTDSMDWWMDYSDAEKRQALEEMYDSFVCDYPADEDYHKYVSDALRLKYISPFDSKGVYEFCVPEILLNSADAEKVNNEILTKHESCIDSIVKNMGMLSATLNYKYYADDNVLSVIVYCQDSMAQEYDIYNFDIVTGELLDTEDMCLYYGKSYDDIMEGAKTWIKDYFAAFEGESYYDDRCLELSLSDENLAFTRLYLENGRLFVTIRYESMLAGVRHYKTIDITDSFELNDSVILGDSNGDSKVNVKDATRIQKAVAGIVILTERAEILSDTDGNNKLNVKDATAIQKWVAGIKTGFPIGEPAV